MAQSINISIDGRSVELFFSTHAMIRISERCGGNIDKLGEYLEAKTKDGESGTIANQLYNLSTVIADLANGAVIKHNADKALGFEQGEKLPLYPEYYFADVLTPGDFNNFKEEIFEALNCGMDFEVPDGIKLKEVDGDLEEIKEAKRKKEDGALT